MKSDSAFNNPQMLIRYKQIMLIRTKRPVCIMIFEVILAMVMLCFHPSSHMSSRLNAEVYIRCLELVVLSWTERVAAGWPYARQRENPVLAERKFLRRHHSTHLASWLPRLQPTFFYMWSKVKQKTSKTLWHQRKAMGKACERFLSHLWVAFKDNFDFFE